MFRDGDITGVVKKELTSYPDSRGWLMELFRKDETDGFEPAMSYISLTRSGIIRGPHEHREQTDYFCFLGNFSLFLWDNRKDSPTFNNRQIIRDADKLVVIVPPGIVHAYKNTGNEDAMVINFPDRLYSGWGKKEKIDEIRYEDDPETLFKVE